MNERQRSESNVMNGNLSRRDLLALSGAALAGATKLSAFQSTKKLYAYVSSWTKGPFGAGGGGGITAFTVNMSDGSLTQVFKTPPEFDGLNGGNLCISASGRFLYCTHEAPTLNGKAGTGGGVHAFAINPENGSLAHLNVQPSMGVNPCFIVVDKTGNRVLVANHGDFARAVQVVKRNGVPAIENPTDDGTVSMFAVKADGSLEPACDVAVFERRSLADPGPGAAAHSVNFDNTGRWAVACDVGANHIYVFPFDPASRAFGTAKVFPTPPDRAPRHSAFHPRLPYFFITNERESILSSFHFDSSTGDVRPINTVPTIPADFKERNALAGHSPSPQRQVRLWKQPRPRQFSDRANRGGNRKDDSRRYREHSRRKSARIRLRAFRQVSLCWESDDESDGDVRRGPRHRENARRVARTEILKPACVKFVIL